MDKDNGITFKEMENRNLDSFDAQTILYFNLSKEKFKSLETGWENVDSINGCKLAIAFDGGAIIPSHSYGYRFSPTFVDGKYENHWEYLNFKNTEDMEKLCKEAIKVAEEAVRSDFKKYLTEEKEGNYLSSIIGYGFYKDDIKNLAIIHRDGDDELKAKVEDLLESCNFHTEYTDFQNGNYNDYIEEQEEQIER